MHNKVFCFINNFKCLKVENSQRNNCFPLASLSITIWVHSSEGNISSARKQSFTLSHFIYRHRSSSERFKVSFSWNETCLITKQMLQLNKLRVSTFILFFLSHFMRDTYLHQRGKKVNSAEKNCNIFLMRWWLWVDGFWLDRTRSHSLNLKSAKLLKFIFKFSALSLWDWNRSLWKSTWSIKMLTRSFSICAFAW